LNELMNTMPITFQTAILNDHKAANIDGVEAVPIGNKESYNTLLGEGEKYEFVNRIALGDNHPAYPDSWTTVILTEDWAKSYAKGVNSVPAPLFLAGHADQGVHYKMRAIPDGYVVGARLKDGYLYLRNSMSSDGTEERKALIQQTIREIKAKMLSTSSSDIIKFKIERDEATDKTVYMAIESVKGRSNALVEADMTGSDAEIVVTSFKSSEKSGVADFTHIKQGESEMDKETLSTADILTALKNQLDSGRLPINDVASNLGITVLTEANKLALKRLEDAEKEVGSIDTFISGIKADKEKVFVQLKEAAIKDKFKDDALIETATQLFSLKAGTVEEINAEVEKLASMKIFTQFRSASAGSIGASFQTEGNYSSDKDEAEAMEG